MSSLGHELVDVPRRRTGARGAVLVGEAPSTTVGRPAALGEHVGETPQQRVVGDTDGPAPRAPRRSRGWRRRRRSGVALDVPDPARPRTAAESSSGPSTQKPPTAVMWGRPSARGPGAAMSVRTIDGRAYPSVGRTAWAAGWSGLPARRTRQLEPVPLIRHETVWKPHSGEGQNYGPPSDAAPCCATGRRAKERQRRRTATRAPDP